MRCFYKLFPGCKTCFVTSVIVTRLNWLALMWGQDRLDAQDESISTSGISGEKKWGRRLSPTPFTDMTSIFLLEHLSSVIFIRNSYLSREGRGVKNKQLTWLTGAGGAKMSTLNILENRGALDMFYRALIFNRDFSEFWVNQSYWIALQKKEKPTSMSEPRIWQNCSIASIFLPYLYIIWNKYAFQKESSCGARLRVLNIPQHGWVHLWEPICEKLFTNRSVPLHPQLG